MVRILKSSIAIFLFLIALTGSVLAADVQVTLVWDPNSETDLAGYRLYWGTESRTVRTGGGYPNFIDIGNATTGDIFPLTDSTKYYFAATAYDTSGNESPYSIEVPHTTPDLTGPGSPIGLRVTVSVKVDIQTTP